MNIYILITAYKIVLRKRQSYISESADRYSKVFAIE